MKIRCPECGAIVVAKRSSGRFPEHFVENATRTFARVVGDTTSHFFDYRERCLLSDAWFTLELRT